MALPVVKKLPVLFRGNSSIIERNIKGVIIWFEFRNDFEKYFLKKVIYKNIKKIDEVIKKPIKPVSVKISK